MPGLSRSFSPPFAEAGRDFFRDFNSSPQSSETPSLRSATTACNNPRCTARRKQLSRTSRLCTASLFGARIPPCARHCCHRMWPSTDWARQNGQPQAVCKLCLYPHACCQGITAKATAILTGCLCLKAPGTTFCEGLQVALRRPPVHKAASSATTLSSGRFRKHEVHHSLLRSSAKSGVES